MRAHAPVRKTNTLLSSSELRRFEIGTSAACRPVKTRKKFSPVTSAPRKSTSTDSPTACE